MAKKKSLLRLTASIYNNPHLISVNSFNIISSYLDMRNIGDMMKFDNPDDENPADPSMDDDDDESYDPLSGVGMVQVQGSLTYRPVAAACGEVGTSYQELQADVEELIEAGAKLIILNCDSGGGEGYGAFETADNIRQMADDAGVKLIAYVDGMAASACYAIACACDEVIANPLAEVGSIGVLVALLNNSQQLANMGIVRSFITAGDSKIPFDADGGWKDSFLEDLQMKVDRMYTQFVSHVSKYTGLDPEVIQNTEAKTFLANDALNLGLVNKVMTNADFVNYVASIVPNNSMDSHPDTPWPMQSTS